MSPNATKICLMMISIAILVYNGVWAQSSGCTSAIMSLSPCLNYVTGSSSTPSSSCCSQLAKVVQSQPKCLCSALGGGASSVGITVNRTQALALPGACKVQAPPVSQCSGPSASPVGSPVGSPPADASSHDASSITPTASGTNIP